MNSVNRITRNPAVLSGRPIIRGMRITVSTVVELVAAGHSFERILEAYPILEHEDIVQALRYAAMLASDSSFAFTPDGSD